ncbi:hypothetical protein HJG60_008604 [Phyllostomus discolor]|uniref:Uncharacterized protein n=1 Tax=Phyllostomus discolor TaxID=89673 RepID=A0A833YSZ0_9CHIR|nr:hypothetical protein HJG60_008604 [Phyllostomus discolor]
MLSLVDFCACALTGNRTGDPLVRRPVLNPLSYTSQGETFYFFFLILLFFFYFNCCLSSFLPFTPTPALPTSLPLFLSSLVTVHVTPPCYCPCVLYTCFCKPFPLSPETPSLCFLTPRQLSHTHQGC